MPVMLDAVFKTANGMRYIRFLEHLHQRHVFDWYMEIGCRSGKSFAPVRSRTIAVDLQDYGLERFWDSFDFADARAEAEGDFALWAPAAATAGTARTPEWVSP